jgi:hypothetical protein
MGDNATYVECEEFHGIWYSGILNFDRLRSLSGIWKPSRDAKIGYIWKNKKHYVDMKKFNNLSLYGLWKSVIKSEDGEIIPE